MKTLRIALAGSIALCVTAAPMAADKGEDGRDGGARLRANLSGYDEVPSVNTPARGRFRATLSDDGHSIAYTLSYDGIASVVQQSHIHFAQKSVNGSIVIWLCQGATRAPAGVPTPPECPRSPGGTVTGTITAANVLASSTVTQQLPAGNLDAVLAATRGGSAYANVHSLVSPGGEIRGQVKA